MDAYLGERALRTLESLALLGSPASAGFLLGERKGFRFFIDEALPTRRDFFPSLEAYFQASSLNEDGVIGFFSFDSTSRSREKILSPLGCGKVFLLFKVRSKKISSLRAFFIDRTHSFVLKPLPLIIPKKR